MSINAIKAPIVSSPIGKPPVTSSPIISSPIGKPPVTSSPGNVALANKASIFDNQFQAKIQAQQPSIDGITHKLGLMA